MATGRTPRRKTPARKPAGGTEPRTAPSAAGPAVTTRPDLLISDRMFGPPPSRTCGYCCTAQPLDLHAGQQRM